VKLVKGEGRATRARARSPRRAGPCFIPFSPLLLYKRTSSSGTDTHSHTQVLLLRRPLSSPSVLLLPVQLHLYDYTEQGPSTISMYSPRDNGAPVDSVNRPAFGYILNLFCVILFKFYLKFNLNTCTCFALTGSLIFVMNVLIISGIKMY
jgi:hypothetical protein